MLRAPPPRATLRRVRGPAGSRAVRRAVRERSTRVAAVDANTDTPAAHATPGARIRDVRGDAPLRRHRRIGRRRRAGVREDIHVAVPGTPTLPCLYLYLTSSHPLYRTFTCTFTLSYPRVPTLPSQDVHSAPAACLGAALVLSLPLWLLCNVAAKTFALQEEDETLVHEERWKMTLDGVGDWRRHAAMADVADQVRRRNAKAWPTFGRPPRRARNSRRCHRPVSLPPRRVPRRRGARRRRRPQGGHFGGPTEGLRGG